MGCRGMREYAPSEELMALVRQHPMLHGMDVLTVGRFNRPFDRCVSARHHPQAPQATWTRSPGADSIAPFIRVSPQLDLTSWVNKTKH